MCLLIAATEFPPEDLLRKAYEQNKDGIGIAYKTTTGIRYWKGITFDDLKLFKSLGKREMLIHFRVSTVGGAKPELCHPFPVTEKVELDLRGEVPAVFAHNGTVRNWDNLLIGALSKDNKCPPGPDWSDSRAVAFLVHTYGKDFLHLISDGQRFAVLDEDGISRYGLWHKFNDNVFTSYNVEDRRSKYVTPTNGQTMTGNTTTHSQGSTATSMSNTDQNTGNGDKDKVRASGLSWNSWGEHNKQYANNPSGTGGSNGQASNSETSSKSNEQKSTEKAPEETKKEGAETVEKSTPTAIIVAPRDINYPSRSDRQQQYEGYIGTFKEDSSNVVGMFGGQYVGHERGPSDCLPKSSHEGLNQHRRKGLHSMTESEYYGDSSDM